ncbi:DUF2975 domain-containing protein [Francisella sp. Scap27]|uniref:DUF2975 domain-containing protein n=1 Tax=Francisella sp. Scap27 TaxID=2589986 RepID=UPI0015C0E5FE|nr:DUF2975 domain-containing protein [Francisella sp. Scap27]QLE78308.1 DUF2975 domain-containing protein [Francisella sp. Scap27]
MTNRFQKCNTVYKLIFVLIFLITIILPPLYWATVQTPTDLFTEFGIYQEQLFQINHPPSIYTRILALCVSLIPTLSLLYILRLFIRLFGCYQNLEIFSEKVTTTYKKIGWAFVYWVIAQIIYGPLISLVLSYNNPVGERFITAEINGMDFVILILAGFMMMLATVMKKADNAINK